MQTVPFKCAFSIVEFLSRLSWIVLETPDLTSRSIVTKQKKKKKGASLSLTTVFTRPQVLPDPHQTQGPLWPRMDSPPVPAATGA